MTVININTVPDEGLPDLLTLFEGVTPETAARTAEAVATNPVPDDAALQATMVEAGLQPDRAERLLSWFFAQDDPCPCWHGINVNDIPADETAERFSLFDGVSDAMASELEAIRQHEVRPAETPELVRQMIEAGVPAPLAERLTGWIGAEIDDATNAPNWVEIDADLAEGPIIEDVNPASAAPGDTLALNVRGMHPGEPAQVHVNGYPADLITVDAERNLIEAVVPRDAADFGEVDVTCGGMPALEPWEIEITPKIHREDCPDGNDARLIALGTSHPVLIDVERTDPVSGEGELETLETTPICGTNAVTWRGGHSTSPLPAAYALNTVMNPALAGLSVASLPLLAQVAYVQLVGRKEKDASGEYVMVYYFFRNGKWWRITDPKRMHPEDPTLIDVRELAMGANYTEADAKTQTSFNRKYNPTIIDRAWRALPDPAQSQIMWALLWQMNGLGAEEARVLFDIKKRLDRGESVDKILSVHGRFLLWHILLPAFTAGAGVIAKRLMSSIFARRLIAKITEVRRSGDEIELSIKRAYHIGTDAAKRDKSIRGGMRGHILGRVDKRSGTLFCDYSMGAWENRTGRRRFATQVFARWIEELKKFGRARGAKSVLIRRQAGTKAGEKMLKRLGFEKYEDRMLLSGTTVSMWRKAIPLN